MTAAMSLPCSAKILLTAASSSNGATRVSLATFAETPALELAEAPARPLPAFTNKESECP